jgi:hypothetical protein
MYLFRRGQNAQINSLAEISALFRGITLKAHDGGSFQKEGGRNE